ncbi:DegT/DnrJ/EryC1/StrS family aminotransferase [Rhodovastum atsumiense]|uniref:Transcriptional regulator n=1 Tax=Rhodovastum atsumiense TaxID=504468 RepID=A0A5M6ITD3_9PROT|nr:DegT/DnrJ/EryC1/StrS family aminotransferase [Rhodovastum atsumiense]KAA5611471.1 transcriptional regulator [Rhodovastum atsumiense]
MPIPLTRPNPVHLSRLGTELEQIDASGIFSNYGPVNARFEHDILAAQFGGTGSALTVCNATIGLMLAMRHAVGPVTGARRYALMPSFTFSALAQAALWCGLTPLLCDIDEETWLPSAVSEHQLLRKYADEIAVIAPYATFGNGLNLRRYAELSRRTGIPVVVDAAASLGSADARGMGFGTGFAHPIVFSMHATKAFATAEGGLIYCANPQTTQTLRTMGNFGFGVPRSATMPGLNSKLSEVGALLALAKLREFPAVVEHRMMLTGLYRTLLPGFTFQRMTLPRHAYQFMPVLLPAHLAGTQDRIIAELQQRGIGAAHYFSPHLAEQPFFRERCVAAPLAVTERLALRMLSLPMSDLLTPEQVGEVCETLVAICEELAPVRRHHRPVDLPDTARA